MTDNEIDVIADTINEIIERAETALNQLGFNVEAHVEVLGRRLTYAQKGRDWRLVWIEDDKKTLVRDSSRRLRIEAARAFPKLYEKITETNRVLVEDARQVAEDFDQFVCGLEEQVEDRLARWIGTERDRT